MGTKEDIELELANGLEALDALEFFEQRMLSGKIQRLGGCHYDINTMKYRSIVAETAGGPFVGEDLFFLYKKMKEERNHE